MHRYTEDGEVMNHVLTDQPSEGRQTIMIGCSMLPQNPGKTYSELVQSLTNLPNVKIEKKKKDTELMVEMLAMERDAKRRRTSYKNKVHTKNKSHLEVLREVVEQQMELLKGPDDNETPAEPDDKQKETREDMLIELKDISGTGNPYLVWQNVEKYLVNKESQVQNIAKSEKSYKDNEKHQLREEKTKRENHRKHKHKSRDRSPSSRHRKKERKERSRSRHKHSPSAKHHKRSPSRYEHSHSHSKKSRHS
ncbi:glutamic acid-rich protein-like isoform X2 [Cimex lectularius]|uniref:Uncharacterized protein n=1 Tax=Cimex lectularius TaxID=79782 RepID=A0A8I6S3V9_CIMLE|nr:glutamic acid-rich protein-like isoform X2 [Cimex lectularius]